MFMWTMLYGRTPSFSYLYRMNIGPLRECVFYGLEEETYEHILWKCQKCRRSWTIIGKFEGVDVKGIDHFTAGEWITKS